MAARTFEDFPYEDLLTYAGIDTYVTYKLLMKIYPEVVETPDYKIPKTDKFGAYEIIKAPSVLQEALAIKKDAIQFMVDMRVNGIAYDVALNNEYEARMKEHILSLENKLREALGVENLNFDSDLEMESLLFDKLGLETTVKTKGGKPSVSGDALQEMFKKYGHSWLKDLIIRNDVASVYRSFILDYVPKYVKRDGRIHPNYNLHGTSSHRISGDNPNLLNIPSPKHGYNIRSLYRVSAGNAFLTFDFSSCEVKVLAALCKDPTMLVAIEQGLDFHTYTASQMYKIPYDEMYAVLQSEDESDPRFKIYKNYRKGAKAVTFDILEAA